MLQYIIPASGLLFTLQNIIWINLGVFIGAVFAGMFLYWVVFGY